ncbi:hypothetical protein [Thalassoglobus polymorphus]|uniref:Uncharacterized protein n=1 Tax=Thalassoglobus polymorphus TaxID=2527994 RepID=A0A517QHB7_9PLAN|nr:hypothetical protein [Thalassoglobus polymorphus]QDT30902.1 hypothetical protein Mal48_01310 [Thalassoglobus polymorphus]QDT30947.1 hypothetical protein Mal48_01760 [Thalassoglobus polymorphus]
MTDCQPERRTVTQTGTLLEDIREAIEQPGFISGPGTRPTALRGVAALCLCHGMGWTQEDAAEALGFSDQSGVAKAMERSAARLRKFMAVDLSHARNAGVLCPHCGEDTTETGEEAVFELPADGFQVVDDPRRKFQ